MPPLADNSAVACHVDDIYIYLRAVADGALVDRPEKNEPQPPAAAIAEAECAKKLQDNVAH